MALTPMEILAPAGDEEMLRAAVFSGADCVYLGIGKANARQGAKNFTPAELVKAVAFCHARNCKVYAAINTLVPQGKATPMEEAVQAAVQAGCDAIIVQDFATAHQVRLLAPQMPLHASTQMSIHSLAGVQQMAQMGFSRVILSRELSLTEIEYIGKQSPIELEVFVHGALCVSVSGQCYMSAFLGGRSGNQGSCAGPCRLPFEALPGGAWEGTAPPQTAKRKNKTETEAHHLSLRDLSVLEALPRLSQAGVCSAKIEGRLRGPDYVAFVVDAAKKARNANPYDTQTLEQIFSRSGFTDGWFSGKLGGDMFGIRTQTEKSAAKTASAKAREFYRREAPRVPIQATLQLKPGSGLLTITDGVYTVTQPIPGPFSPSETDTDPLLTASLEKTGGTPFFITQTNIQTGGLHLPAALVNNARRQALAQLLALRETPYTLPAPSLNKNTEGLVPPTGWPVWAGSAQTGTEQNPAACKPPLLRARFEKVSRMPTKGLERVPQLVLPLSEAHQVPANLRHKTWLWLPRVLFGNREQQAAAQIAQTADLGFAGYEIGNLGQLPLCKGLPISAGFSLNITNSTTAEILAQWGCQTLTLSPEITLAQAAQIANYAQLPPGTTLNLLAYGHMPLMVTRACPLQNVTSCRQCPKNGLLTDRQSAAFPLLCRDGARTIYNPVPLWMGDRLTQLPTNTATLYFTTESPHTAAQVIQAFQQGQAAQGRFTRGLYDKGTS